ncbi:MAG: 4-hydroxy-tetrahydrodipicolinate reductase [SAR324 cluster bacterium]|nr:4-hydroxy-tetrahydrodipicolinate reductase [SAR324 cluster bacterium]
MKVALVGYGQMGKMIEACAIKRGDEVVARIDPYGDADFKDITAEAVKDAEVVICFTQPNVALENISKILALNKPLVMGTTGWTEQLEEVRSQVDQAGVGMVYSSNFSLGVNLFFRMVKEAAGFIDRFDDYDIAAHEFHHKKKRDSPSGTAITLGNILLGQIKRKTKLETGRLDRMPEDNELHLSSTRIGSIPGTHQVQFDSAFDTIELTHTARTREGFATGALVAAEWVINQQGLFTESDLMDHLLS